MMRQRGFILVAVVCICSATGSHAAFETTAVGPRSRVLGHSTVSGAADVWAIFGYPAELAVNRPFGAGFFHVPGLFGMNELCFSGGGVSIPVAGAGIGISATWFGGELYRETVLGIAVGREVMPGIGIGFRGRFNRLTISNYGSCSAVTLDVGIRVECMNILVIAGSLTNLTSATLGKSGETLPQELAGSVTYNPDPDLHFSFTAAKELLSPLELKIGVEAGFFEPVTLRAGVSDYPSTLAGGCGIRIGDVSMDYAFVYHWVLGATHEIGVSVCFP